MLVLTDLKQIIVHYRIRKKETEIYTSYEIELLCLKKVGR